MSETVEKMRVAIGADHAGFQMKESILRYLELEGHVADDVGTNSEESVDYPDFAVAVANRVAAGRDDVGIVVCGTGIGMSITANKVGGIRAALAHDTLTARLAREHNDANVLALGARVIGPAEAIEIVREFLAVPFAGGRHLRRILKISELDQARAQKV